MCENEKELSIELQIAKFVRTTKCSFKLGSNSLNVNKIDQLSILPYTSGDFEKWNTKYNGNIKLEISDEKGGYLTNSYNIIGYANIKNNTVITIDSIIDVYKR